ncbi:unnamed protein product [Notodromas monacha]|uniref:Uncharacterized protein n=1 Tax=Notodromas monacha TaxID=399045 RepID=A0A7R9G9A6_9CRUS|nr:unnamed protein product [Notodromas monacha]CAG0912649.1 unnamed protein product [Notodromas monacha]
MGCNFGVICRPNGFLKIVEIVLGLICMILLRAYNIDWGQGDALTGLDRRLMGITTIGGMLLVTIPLLISYMINDTGLEKSTLRDAERERSVEARPRHASPDRMRPEEAEHQALLGRWAPFNPSIRDRHLTLVASISVSSN